MPLTEKGTEIKKALVEEYGEKKGEQVLYAGKNKGTFTGIDSAYSSVGVSIADIEKMGQEFWNGANGNVGSPEGAASSLPEEKHGPVPVYKGMMDAQSFDEVSPTQSDPPDKRSDNLLADESLVEWAKEEEKEKEHKA